MDPVSITVPQMPKFLKAIHDTPKQELRAMGRSMKKGLMRARKRFIATQLKGAPGITAGKLARGKNIFTYVNARSFQSFGGKIGISRILHVHEKGLTIAAHHGYLYLHEKGKGSPVFAVVPQVRIPARLKFRQQMDVEAGWIFRDVEQAAREATRVTLQTGLLRS